MKNILKSIAIVAAALSLASCVTKEYYTVGSCTSYDLVVRSNMWRANVDQDGGTFYSCEFDVPDLTDQVYNAGLVTCYIDYDGAQQVLPCVRHRHENYEENGEWLDYQWTETTDFEYSIGSVTLYFTSSDFYDDLPAAMQFRLVLTR